MINLANSQFFLATKEFRRLSVLLAINHSNHISQHGIAKSAGLSSAMVNNYIKELVQENFIEVLRLNRRDNDYRLTTRGRRKLFSLLMQCSAEIVQLYAQAKNELVEKFERLFNNGVKHKVVLFGGSETACMVIQAIHRFPQAEISAIVDNDETKWGTMLEGYSITSPEHLPSINPDTIIISSFARQDEIYSSIKELAGRDIKIVKLSSL